MVLLSSTTAFSADTFNGRQLYQTYCESCHGKTGRGEMPGAPNFSLGQGMIRTDLSLLNHIRSGRNAMPAFEGILDNNEILDVISHIRTFY